VGLGGDEQPGEIIPHELNDETLAEESAAGDKRREQQQGAHGPRLRVQHALVGLLRCWPASRDPAA
jgi:hypothetical protein